MENKNYIICEITPQQADILNKYFVGEDGYFNFEGCWLRNQRPENAKKSGYIDETTQRRRYVHFYDSYVDEFFDGKHHLALAKYYLYVTNTMPTEDIDAYYEKILKALEIGKFEKVEENKYLFLAAQIFQFSRPLVSFGNMRLFLQWAKCL